MLQRYERMNSGRAKSILKSALVELADPSDILALIRGYTADKRPYDGGSRRHFAKPRLASVRSKAGSQAHMRSLVFRSPSFAASCSR